MSLNAIGGVGSFDPTELFQSLFKKVDGNSDGSIDKTEFETAVSTLAKGQNVSTTDTDTMFAKLDTDGNGTVDNTEMMAALKTAGEQMRAQMPPPPPPPQGDTNSADMSDNSVFADLIKSLNSSDSSESDMFSSLIKSLSSSSTGSSDLFSQFLESLQSASGSSDDRISSMFSSLVSSLQNSTQYSDQGSLSYDTGSTQSLLSTYA